MIYVAVAVAVDVGSTNGRCGTGPPLPDGPPGGVLGCDAPLPEREARGPGAHPRALRLLPNLPQQPAAASLRPRAA
eukprot:5943968-Pyramimonas_sp.AAC.1